MDHNPSDRELLRLFTNESTRDKAFTDLVTRYQERVYFHIRRLVIDHDDANDVVQNTFIKAWQGLHRFRGDAQLYTWLYRIATNESLTFLKRKKAAAQVSYDESGMEPVAGLADDPLFTGDRLQRKLQEAIARLPHKQKVVFNLRYFDEMKYEEMSEVLETSVGALKASYHHAARKIEDYLLGH